MRNFKRNNKTTNERQAWLKSIIERLLWNNDVFQACVLKMASSTLFLPTDDINTPCEKSIKSLIWVRAAGYQLV